MFRRFAVLIFIAVTCFAKAQRDTSSSPLDKLSPEELLQHYINEPEPWSKFKGPEKIGDSLYSDLNLKVIPTETVNAKGIYRESEEATTKAVESDSSFNSADQAMKPKIGLGAGRMGYDGNVYQNHLQSFTTARYAFDLNISQRLTRYLQLNFNVMFGKLGADERSPTRNANFVSEIRAGGVNLLYDFGNFIPDRYTVRPFVSFGVIGFEFLSKTDLKDANGNTYYYWKDGSIKNMPEGSPNAQYAINLKRDYVYETDVREHNVGILGKYSERSFAMPIGAGFIAKVTDRIDVKMNFQYYFTATNYIDGLTEKTGGSKRKDRFTYSSVSVQYDMIAKPLQKKKKKTDAYEKMDWLAIDSSDYDKDGVTDWNDRCQGTPKNVKVDKEGCPIDTDLDGVPDYRDDEINTPFGLVVDARGVAIKDEYWKKWYDQFMNDSTDANTITEYVGNAFALNSTKNKLDLNMKDQDLYTVELVRYAGSIPSDEMAFLLSIGDINSTTLEDGTTIVYTSGSYKKIKNAIKHRNEFTTMGYKEAAVSKVKGKKIERISDADLAKLIDKEDKTDLQLKTSSDTSKVAITNPNNIKDVNSIENNPAESFGKDDIVYRVQLGAFKNKISSSVFNTSAGVLELKAGENAYRYVTKGFKTIGEAAAIRADLVIQGYSDAFVTAYKGGKRIPMNKTEATVVKGYKEDMNENKMFSSVNKKLVVFKIQLGPNKRTSQVAAADEKYKDLPDLQKQATTTGNVRYTTGSFPGYDAAEKYRKELEGKGFTDAFIIATFKDELISIQEALELLK